MATLCINKGKVSMEENLVIVESPAKAKTIEKILGKDFTVKSSMGHVRDLMKKGVDVENNFEPQYEVSSDKQKVVKELKDWVKKVDDECLLSAKSGRSKKSILLWNISRVQFSL